MEDTDNDENVYDLNVETELRLVVGAETTNFILVLLNGYAEIFGAELVRNRHYTFPPSSSVALFTWQGCKVKLIGRLEKVEVSQDSLIMVSVSMHACLEEMRMKAHSENSDGPVCLVVGPTDVGKTSFCHFLLNYAARMGRRPVFVDLDVGQNSLAIPGSLCVLPVDRPADASSGFSQDTLTVYPFGHKSPGHNIALYFLLIKKLGHMIRNRLKNAVVHTRSAGIVIDTCGWVRGRGYSAITLAACSFEIDVLFVVEEEKLYLELKKDMPASVKVVYVPQQYGIRERSKSFRAKSRDNRVWHYFYGTKGDLNPHIIEVKFSDIEIYSAKPPFSETDIDSQNVNPEDIPVVSERIGPHLEKCILGLSFADKVDENLMLTNIIGYVAVMNVDMGKQYLTLLSPQPGPLPNRICILGEIKLRSPTD